jgi:Na+/proline symporter
LKINILFGIGLLLIPWSIVNGGGIVSVWNGIGGFSGKFTNLFDRNGIAVFLNFGIPVTIGLMSGPFGDQAFWQRAFAVKKEKVRSSFIIGAFIFGAVPLLMSFLGFLGAGLKFVPKEAQFINLEIVLRLLPAWTLALFAYMIMSGLISALDSHMTAILSVGGHDLINSFSKKGNSECDKRSVKWARTSAILVTILAITIANIPGMQILYLFLFYGTLRASTLMPTVITLLSKKPISETGVFWGIVVSVCIGLPIFAYGNFKNELSFTVTGSLLTVLASGIITLSFRKNLKHKQIL